MQEWMRDVTMDMLPDAQRRIAEVIGVEATIKLCEVYGGSTLYVPMNDTLYKETARNKDIRARYLKGAKIATLAARYGLSEQTILRIVRNVRPGQISAFEIME